MFVGGIGGGGSDTPLCMWLPMIYGFVCVWGITKMISCTSSPGGIYVTRCFGHSPCNFGIALLYLSSAVYYMNVFTMSYVLFHKAYYYIVA